MRVCLIIPTTEPILSAEQIQPDHFVDLKIHDLEKHATDLELVSYPVSRNGVYAPLKSMSGRIGMLLKDYTVSKLMEPKQITLHEGGDICYLQFTGASLIHHSSGATVAWAMCPDQQHVCVIMDGPRDYLTKHQLWKYFLGTKLDPSTFTIDYYNDEDITSLKRACRRPSLSLSANATSNNEYPWWLPYDEILGNLPEVDLLYWISKQEVSKLAYLTTDEGTGFTGTEELAFKAFKHRRRGGKVDKYLKRLSETLIKLSEGVES